MRPATNDTAASYLWFVRASDDPKQCNMEVTMMKVPVGTTFHEHQSSNIVEISTLVNTKEIKKGTELRFLRPSNPASEASKKGVKRPFDCSM